MIPSIKPLLQDAESVIRQHLAAQLLPLAVTAMIVPVVPNRKVQAWIDDPSLPKEYDAKGYRIVVTVVMDYLNTLMCDPELEVRRAAADAVSGLSLQILPRDVPVYCLPIPVRLALEKPKNGGAAATSATGNAKSKRSDEEQRQEELRITAANLLAEMGGAASEHKVLQEAAGEWVRETVLPAILELAVDPSFRVRRCAAQAMPRLLGACRLEDAVDCILPAFTRLSQDDIHRVRKSTGECLVDMSRALVIMASAETDVDRRDELYEQRRLALLPIAERLIQDSHKMVRQGMMQFLGPFMASFYPYQYSPLYTLLPSSTESDGSNHLGIVAQFFPHATSMVSRLNSSQNATATAPTPVHSSLEQLSPKLVTDLDKLQQALPTFLRASRMSAWSLQAVTTHRQQHPPEALDVKAIVDTLLDYFVALAAVQTGDENTDAEMRVYCAYSFPAIVLLLGREHWEGAVRTCFHTLLNPRYPEEPPDADDDEDDDNEPPLPVKRCLASSLHTIAHILGSEITVNDIIGVVQNCFLNDGDDSVRLSTIRNFPALLKLLPVKERREPFLLWSEVVQSDEMLGGKKRSATNPTVLNWRQRDYLARSLPDLILLIDPALIHKHIWPILKLLLQDAIDIVREDALWAIPILLKSYCVETLAKWPHIAEHAKKFSADACLEVNTWIKETILRVGSRNKIANFSDRQLYCRICFAVGLALRFSEGDLGADAEKQKDPVSVLSNKFKSFFFTEKQSDTTENGPYQRLTSAEQKHLRRLLMEDLLPTALEMKEDRISNVRITLMKGLQFMPADVRASPAVKAVLKDLEEESETWTSFGEEEPPFVAQQQQPPQQQVRLTQEQSQPAQRSASGPVDVDDVAITPDVSREEAMDDESHNDESDPSSCNDEVHPRSEAPAVEDHSASAHSDSSDSAGPVQVAVPKAAKTASETSDLKSVVFEAGSIGMQLEPTADDSGCRVCGFLDADDSNPSPARVSGKIAIGDVIVKVNATTVSSYDSTIAILKAGGRRKITFRPGKPGDEMDEAVDGAGDSDDAEEARKREKKIRKDAHAKKVKRDTEKPKKDEKDKEKKHKKEKKEKKVKKEKNAES